MYKALHKSMVPALMRRDHTFTDQDPDDPEEQTFGFCLQNAVSLATLTWCSALVAANRVITSYLLQAY